MYQAYNYQVIYSTQKDTIFDKGKIADINEIQEKYENVERKKELQKLKFDKQIEGKRMVMLIILILSILAFSALIAMNFMIKRH